jgi:hypothetical protein
MSDDISAIGAARAFLKTAPEGAAREGFGARGDGSYNPVNAEGRSFQ